MSDRDDELAVIAKAHGASYARDIIREARRYDVPISLAFALIEQESGFRNVFGHDPTIFRGAGQVTRDKYRAYKKARGHTRMQGVGPAQLCVAPETRILTADLRWTPAADVGVGTSLVSFDEEGVAKTGALGLNKRRCFRTGVVEAMKIERMERVEVETNHEAIVVTPSHPFLVWRPERYHWVAADMLTSGDRIASLPTWGEDTTYYGGYIAGQFDGEGCLSMKGRSAALLWSQSAAREDVGYMEALLERAGFATARAVSKGCGWAGTAGGQPVAHVSIKGGWVEQARFLGTFRPRRLLGHARLEELWDGRQMNGTRRATVRSVGYLDPGDMVAHRVNTRTLVTNGLLSHNTWWSYQDEADLLGGCWRPDCNIRVGLRLLASHISREGRSRGIARYNGSGPAADRYANQVLAKMRGWHDRLG